MKKPRKLGDSGSRQDSFKPNRKTSLDFLRKKSESSNNPNTEDRSSSNKKSHIADEGSINIFKGNSPLKSSNLKRVELVKILETNDQEWNRHISLKDAKKNVSTRKIIGSTDMRFLHSDLSIGAIGIKIRKTPKIGIIKREDQEENNIAHSMEGIVSDPLLIIPNPKRRKKKSTIRDIENRKNRRSSYRAVEIMSKEFVNIQNRVKSKTQLRAQKRRGSINFFKNSLNNLAHFDRLLSGGTSQKEQTMNIDIQMKFDKV